MRDALRIAAPLTLWLAAFSAVYALQGLTCAEPWPGAPWAVLPLGRPLLIAAAVLAVALQAGLLLLLRGPWASPRPFVRRVSLILAAAGVIGAAWSLLPVLVATTC